MSDINFCNTKEQLNHLGEVVTGKVDGSPTGSDIDTSTLPYTGQVRKTLPALEGEYEQSITDKEVEADAAIDSYRLLNKGPYSSEITLESKFEYITYNGESYFATNPPYTTTATTPDADGNLFLGGYTTFENVANKIGNKNELLNPNFLIPSPDAITHPNATPESYVAGTQIFSGVYAGGSGCTITFIDGRVNCTSGDYQFKLPNTGGLERVPVFTSSVSDYDGIPKTTGVSHALISDEHVLTVVPAAGDVFSVKLEQGSVTTRHEVSNSLDTLNSISNGTEPLGSKSIKVDPVDNAGPFQARALNTVANIAYFVDPANGSDGNDGLTAATAFATPDKAMGLVPYNIYHKVDIYLLDGDYSSVKFRWYNHFISPRAGANGSYRIWGHVASYQGASHPIYTNDDNSLVVLGQDFVTSGLIGTDQCAIIGVTFKDSWIQPFDTLLRIYRCHFQGGYSVPGFDAKLCITGHKSTVRLLECTADDVACVVDANGNVNATIEGCSVTNMVDSPAFPGSYGAPINSTGQSKVLIKNSPTFFDAGFNGKRNTASNDGTIDTDGALTYSSAGNNVINRADPRADETLHIQGGNGSEVEQARGGGVAVYGRNHPSKPGWSQIDFGPDTNARVSYTYTNASLVTKEVAKLTTGGNLVLNGYSVISQTTESVLDELEDGKAAFAVLANGDVLVYSQVSGAVKYTVIHDYSTATPL